MRAPRLIACTFGPNERFARMARVLRYSARLHNPAWSIEVAEIRTEPIAGMHRMASLSHEANTQKLQYWAEAVAAAPAGDRLLLVDVDTMVLQSLEPLWSLPFDVAYTTRPHRYPFNAGVIGLRVTDHSRGFMHAWATANLAMLRDGARHQIWREQFGGINQASLGYLLREKPPGTAEAHVRELPCLEWNCEDSHWAKATPERTRIVHVKSQLRLAVFRDGQLPTRRADWLVTEWRRLEADAIRADAHHGRTP